MSIWLQTVLPEQNVIRGQKQLELPDRKIDRQECERWGRESWFWKYKGSRRLSMNGKLYGNIYAVLTQADNYFTHISGYN